MKVSGTSNYRRLVLRQIAQYTWNNCLPDNIYDILYKFINEDTPRVRCCVHKERAVLKNRIQMALWQPIGLNIINAATAALSGHIDKSLPLIDVLPAACDSCPIEKYYITEVCRHCIQHNCINKCPKNAISVQGNRAVIDRDYCIECGLCVKACPFSAIIEVVRPCIKACPANAISVAPNKLAVIDHDKCVSCGNCRNTCPFGALEARSFIVPVLLALKNKQPVTALLAPSVIGQFGINVTNGQLAAGLKKLGFQDIVDVSDSADMVTLHEAEEFTAKVHDRQPFMTSSCCPAFVDFIKKHRPNTADKISETVSPMVAAGRWIKQQSPSTLTCFIGPCIAKKNEALDNSDSIDYVLTFEELLCIFDGIGIDLSQLNEEPYNTTASAKGLSFPLKCGVQKAIAATTDTTGRKLEYACGLTECADKLDQLEAGTLKADYLEGMACQDGCINGPGTLVHSGITHVLLEKRAKTLTAKTSVDNQAATEAAKILNLNVKK